MIRIVVIDVGNRHTIVESLAQNTEIELVGAIVSVATFEEQQRLRMFYESIKCPIVDFETLRLLNVDFLLVINCPKILEMDLLKGVNTLNLHGGVLPKYRGSSSNAWAVINGEKEVGYSLHKLSSKVDAGDIYKVYTQPIKDTEHYGTVRERLEQMVCEDLSQTLKKIKSNEIIPISQIGEKHCYTTKLHKDDGILDWNKDTEYIYGIYRTMSKPYGTGVFFNHDEELYEVVKMSKVDAIAEYICVPGAIISSEDSAIIVKTGNTAVQIDEINLKGKTIVPSQQFKIGMRL